MGHIAAKCQMPKRERGSCFKCHMMGHKARDCPAAEKPKSDSTKDIESKTSINSVSGKSVGDFSRELDYKISNGDFALSCRLDLIPY